MAETDYRTTVKALYVLHRFACDGAPIHQKTLQARLRELRRTRDQKRKLRYFDKRLILKFATKGQSEADRVELQPVYDFIARYAHYVIMRAQHFAGPFNDLGVVNVKSSGDKDKDKGRGRGRGGRREKKRDEKEQPITKTSLRLELLQASKAVLKAGCECKLRSGEDTEVTAACMERVANDLNLMCSTVATTLSKTLSGGGVNGEGVDKKLVKEWCEFYSAELLPQTKLLLKDTAKNLDRHNIFIPTRLGAGVTSDLLKRGMEGGRE